jgi:hypothetical protein
MIEQFPAAGWIIKCDEDALYHCVKARILDREDLFCARDTALKASRQFTWQAYRARVGQLIEEWMNDNRPST